MERAPAKRMTEMRAATCVFDLSQRYRAASLRRIQPVKS
jgi:hypothetical protein